MFTTWKVCNPVGLFRPYVPTRFLSIPQTNVLCISHKKAHLLHYVGQGHHHNSQQTEKVH